MKEDTQKLFCKCNSDLHDPGSIECADAEMIITAFDDSIEEINYSNWHTDKMRRAEAIVKAYCAEHNIPLRFVPGD